MKRTGRASTNDLFGDSATSAGAITAIVPLQRDPNMRQVKVGRRNAATLRASDIETLKLHVGQSWTDALATKVASAAKADKARRVAMRLLSARPYSRKELEERLTRRGHDSAIAQKIVQEMVADGWLNERAYADDIVRGATHAKPAGKRLLKQRLQRHGIDARTTDAALASAGEAQDDRAAAIELARRRLATMRNVQPAAAIRRIAGLLNRRGFDEDTVQATIDAIGLTGKRIVTTTTIDPNLKFEAMPSQRLAISRTSSLPHMLVLLLVAFGLAACDRPANQAKGAGNDGSDNSIDPKLNIPDVPSDASAAMAQSPLEAQFAAVLAKVVTPDGLVRYSVLNGDELRASLDAVVDACGIEPLPPESNAKARKALWINAYNANVLKMALVESRREGFTSVNNVPGFFNEQTIVVAGQTMTLDALFEKLRALGDPRIHAAIVCAARGCPPLRSEAYTAGRIDAQLDEQSRSWLDDPSRNRLMPDGIHVSSVFERYASDFNVEPYNGMTGFVRRYTRPAGTIRDYMRNVKDVLYRYIPLNWALNDADTPPGPLAPPAPRAARPSDSQPANP